MTRHAENAPPSSYGARLAATWREKAAELSKYGAGGQATLLAECAAQLETAEREHGFETLTIEAASIESGFSYSSLQQKLASGELENVGKKGSPRVQRCALPRKAGSAQPRSIADVVLARQIRQ